MLKIRRSRDRLISNMGIPILVRRHLYIETVPRYPYSIVKSLYVIWRSGSCRIHIWLPDFSNLLNSWKALNTYLFMDDYTDKRDQPKLDFIYQDCIRHYGDVIMGTMASQITSLIIVYSTVYSGADQRKHQSSASLAFVRGIHRGPVNSPHKWPVTRKMFPFDDVIMKRCCLLPSLLFGEIYRVKNELTTHLPMMLIICILSYFICLPIYSIILPEVWTHTVYIKFASDIMEHVIWNEINEIHIYFSFTGRMWLNIAIQLF